MRTLKQPEKEEDGRRKKETSPGAQPNPSPGSPRSDAQGKEVRLSGFGPVLLYSEPSGEDGVRLHLRDDKSLLARLHDLPLQDLQEPNIDILLSANTEIRLVEEEEGLELFGAEGGEELSLSPAGLARNSEPFSTALVASDQPSADSSSEEPKGDGRAGIRKPAKSSSPNRQGPQRCPVCGKVFGNASALAKHKLTHSDERRYVCTMCAKAFKRQDHLNGHMLTHRNKKPYECKAEGCGKSYCDARSLRRHTENHHSSGGSSSSTPEPSPPTCIQYAPPPRSSLTLKVLNGKSQNSSEKLSKNQLELIQQIMQKTQTQTTTKNSESSKTQVISSSAVNSATSSTKSWTVQANQTITKSVVSSSKPVECNLCHRKFKNIPALNGHMRLHGGYFKKDTDPRRYERRDVNTPPLQTASVSVRALIEEKIILKRITKPCSTTNALSEESTNDSTKATNSAQKTLSVDDPIIKKIPKLGVKRTSSDPGLLKQNESVSAVNLQHESKPFSIEEYNEETGILSPSLQETVFHDGQESVLLEGVDSSSLEESINAADLEDITIEDYQSGDSLPSPQTFQHHKDVRSVLDSPLPANLADFAYTHSQRANNESETTSQNYATSSLTSSNLVFSSAPATQAPTFSSHSSSGQGEDSSTTSSSYYSSSITSTSGAAEPSLLTSRPSHPSSSSTTTILQSQMMPNSEDPLLSSSPKDFVPRKRFDFQTIKLLQHTSLEHGPAEGLAGIVLDRNGEIKLIHSATSQPAKQTSVSYITSKPENGPKIVKTLSIPCKSSYARNREKIGALLVNEIKEEVDEEVFATPSLAVNPVHLMRKRPRIENTRKYVKYRSRLRNVKKRYGSSRLAFTPPPILNPNRPGQGLYWQAATASPSSTTLNKGSNWDEASDIPESDSKPHINVGQDYQCVIPDSCTVKGAKEKLKEHLLWDSKLSKIVSDSEVDKYLEFACCAAVPGGGRNKEHALHLLHICHGRIQEAMLQLMQPTPWLPSGHPLLTFEYSDCEKWTLNEVETFYQALQKYDKDFVSVSKEVPSKTTKQCVQFYYLWKKVCPEDYKRLRLIRKRYRESEHEIEDHKTQSQNGDTDPVSTTSTEGRLFVCEYNECSGGIQ